MAIINCSECRAEISDKAKVCPKCGAPLKRKSSTSMRRRLVFYGAFAVAMVGGVLFIASEERPRNPVAERETAELNVALALARDVRKQIKNPKSFDLNEVRVQRDGVICMTYRATNSFNAVVPAQAIRRGNTYWMSDSDPAGFKELWTQHCTGIGRDETRMVRRFIDG